MRNEMRVLVGFLFCICVGFSFCMKDDESIPTYFRKLADNGKLIDRGSKQYNQDIPNKFVTKISRKDASSVSLKVYPEVAENGGLVAVNWYGVAEPNEKDFISLYCPDDDNPKHYLDYFNIDVSVSWKAGFGEHFVPVFNMRTNCVFKYFRWVGEAGQLAATSSVITFRGGPLAIHQIHLSLTGDPTQMRVMWVSSKAQEVIVNYGTTESLGQKETKFTSNTYKAGDLCHSPANDTGFWDPGYIYDVLLTGLEPNTKYYYTIQNEQNTSSIRSFMTAIPAGDKTPYKFFAYGDQGTDNAPQGKATAKNVILNLQQDEDFRLVFHNGDISYALGYAYVWDQYFTLIEPYASRLPYMVGIGNHEYDHTYGGEHDPSHAEGEGYHPAWGNLGDDSNGECGVPMYHRFHMPNTGNKLWWYSYDYGMVHFIMMSTEHDFSPESPQYTWLEKDLKSVDRTKTPWIIIGGHRAMYCSALMPDDYVVSLNMQRLFEDLLHKYNVDLAFWAHYHSYERTCRVYKQQCSKTEGTVHMVIGAAGRSTDPDAWLPKPWSAYHYVDYGYGKVEVVNSTALKWEWVLNKSGQVFDTYWLTK
ncbi:uncharacterized protein [Clytia hemisphaerica]|uniref:Purple acid phosphatase n=1 Tax=Clytia hemisphaerica TaxID=252671 RepID=A0A7M5V6H9_9CNID